nr:hypothetical protein [Tanacetum cinerariifolium]
MSTPTFAKTHNLIAFLEKPSESDGFEQIVDFLNANQIKYALTVSLTIYTSCIKQFWTTVKIKNANDDVRLQALIDRKKVLINEASIRHDLKLNDAKGFSGAVTPLFGTMMVQALEEVEIHTEDHVPTTSNDPLPSGEDRMQLKELMDLCTNLSNKVLDLENEVIEMKSSHKANIDELESGVEKRNHPNRGKIVDINADEEVNLENMYNLDMAHKETVLSMQDVDVQSERIKDFVKEVAEEMVEVIEIAKIIVDETTVDFTTAPKAKGIVFHDKEELTTRTASSKSHAKDKGKAKIETAWNADMKDNIDWNEVVERVQSRQSDVVRKYQALKRKHMLVAQARKNMMIYLKNMAGFKMDFFKGMSYEEIKPLFEEEYNKVQTLFKEGLEMDSERIKAPRKRTRKEKVEKDQTAKKQKGDKLEQDNAEKQKLEEQGREDLEVLWKIVKDRFMKSQPKEILDVFLWHTLKVMFKHTVEDNVWKHQKGPQGLDRVKNWKLIDSYGVYYVTLDTIQLFLLTEKMYPLINYTLQQMFNEVRLQVDYEVEMAYDLLRLVRKKLMEGYVS